MYERRRFKFKEAADKYYGGDEETLRQAILLGVVRARVEVCEVGHWAWWSDESDDEDLPQSGKSENAQWRRLTKSAYQLTGWFLLSHRAASQIAHGASPSTLIVAEDEEEECFLGLSFALQKSVPLADLWFEPSADNGRFRQPEDEMLDGMADRIQTLTNDQMVIARYEAAAQAGGGAIDIDQIQRLIADFRLLETASIISSAQKSVRDEYRQARASGGKAKAANNSKQSKARDAIRSEFKKWQSGGARFKNDADFAKKMHGLHADAYTNEGSIKNAVSRWRSKKSSS